MKHENRNEKGKKWWGCCGGEQKQKKANPSFSTPIVQTDVGPKNQKKNFSNFVSQVT
jgi:hypothetical protein